MPATPHRHNLAAATADSPNPPLIQKAPGHHLPLRQCRARPDAPATTQKPLRQTTIHGGTRMPNGCLTAAARGIRATAANPFSNTAAIETAAAPDAPSALRRL